MSDPFPLFSAFLRNALSTDLDPAARGSFADMLAEGAVMEFPYASAGMPQVVEGRDAIGA